MFPMAPLQHYCLHITSEWSMVDTQHNWNSVYKRKIGSALLRNEWQDFTQLSSATPSNTSDFLLQGGHSDLLP